MLRRPNRNVNFGGEQKARTMLGFVQYSNRVDPIPAPAREPRRDPSVV